MADVGPNEHMFPMNVAPGKASTIKPSIVCKLSPLGDFCIDKAGPNDIPFGIVQNWTHGAPGTPFDDGAAAREANRAVMVWGPGSIARAAIKDNSPAIAPSSSVGADVDGELTIVNAGAGTWAVGWLLERGTANKSQRLRIFVFPHDSGRGSGS